MSNSLKYTCIFGGGAVRGFSYVGVIKALRELGVELDAIAGSSVGAIFATLYALGYSSDKLAKIVLDFNMNMFKDISLGFGPDFAFSKGELFLNWLRELIETKFYGDNYKKDENAPVKFSDLSTDLYILTCNLNNNKPVVFSKSSTPDVEIAMAIRISACLPGLMKPVEFDDKFLVDGDLIKSWPLWKVDDGLCLRNSRVLEFRLEGCRDNAAIKNPLDYFNSVFSTFSNFCTENVMNLFGNKDKFDYIVVDAKDVLLIDFSLPTEKRFELMDVGYRATIEHFSKTLLAKKKMLLPYYKNMLQYILQIKELIKTNKLLRAKETLLELLAGMHDYVQYIDSRFYKEVIAFKDKFLVDYTCLPFLNICKLADLTNNVKNIQAIIDDLNDKCTELEEYINTYEK